MEYVWKRSKTSCRILFWSCFKHFQEHYFPSWGKIPFKYSEELQNMHSSISVIFKSSRRMTSVEHKKTRNWHNIFCLKALKDETIGKSSCNKDIKTNLKGKDCKVVSCYMYYNNSLKETTYIFLTFKKYLQHFYRNKHKVRNWSLLFILSFKTLDNVANFYNSYCVLKKRSKCLFG